MERSEFKLVLHSVDPDKKSEVRRELAKIFDIDEEIAADIAGAVPIILLAELTLGAVAVVSVRVEGLEERGAHLVVTNAPCDDIPRVNWPESPSIARVSASEAAGRAPAFRELASFRCPTCGEGLKVVRAMTDAPVAPPAVAPAAPRPAVAPKPAPAPAAAPPQAPASVPLAVPVASEPEPFSSERSHVIPATARKSGLRSAAGDSGRSASVPSMANDPGPLVRALEQARERRESARQAPPGPAAAPATARAEPTAAPVAPPPRAPQPPGGIAGVSPAVGGGDDTDAVARVQATPAPGRHDATSSIAPPQPPSTTGTARYTAAAPPTSSRREPPLAPEPVVPPAPRPAPAAPADDFGTFDIDEALRLLDNAPDAPAPVGTGVAPAPVPVRAAPAPAPTPAPGKSAPSARPPSPPMLADSEDAEIDFGDLEADLAHIEAALEPPGGHTGVSPVLGPAPAPSRAPPPAPVLGPPAMSMTPPPPGASASRAPPRPKKPADGDFLAPLDPTEALSILESVKAPSSDETVFSKAPTGPVSDELKPLDPNEALSLLSSSKAAPGQRPAARAPAPSPTAGGTATRLPSGGMKAAPAKIQLTDADLADSNDDLAMVDPPPVPEKSASQRALAPQRGGSGGVQAVKKPAVEPARKPQRQPGDDEPVHGLVLSKIVGDGKRQKAAELIVEVASVSMEEALKLTDRTIIPVLKGVSKEEAEAALAKFLRARIAGRVTTRRVGE